MTDEAPEVAEIDDDDVEHVLDAETMDGKGGAVVPKADFNSYEAGENVTAYQPEKEDN